MSFGPNTTSYTVGSIMDRLFVTYLTPPDAQYVQARLASNVSTAGQTSVTIGSYTIPEDEALMRQGSLLEFSHELMRVVSYDPSSKVAVVERRAYGTNGDTYSTPFLINLNPPYPRASVFEAVADNILNLFPTLFTVRTMNLSSSGIRVFNIPDDLAVSPVSVWPDETANTDLDIHGEIVEYHPEAGGRALVTNHGAGSVWLRYQRRMGKATSESDTLESLGMDERWTSIVMAGAAADLMAGRDISASHAEWVKNVLEAENIRVGTRMSIAGGLRQYRGILLNDAKKEMRGEYGRRVRMRRADAALT